MKRIVIECGRADSQYWRDIWQYKELLYFLAWRDILVRYKQTAIGIAWALIRPLLTMAVFTVVFGRIAKLPSQGTAYPVLVFAAMLPWQYFSSTFADASNSLITNTNLVSKVYFPRMVVPLGAAITNLVDFLISLVLLCVLLAWYRIVPGWKIAAIPFFILIAIAASLGPGLLFAALNVKYRDFRYIVPFVLQAGLYISTVGFASNVVPERWRLLYSLNPMVGVIDGFRWAIIGGSYSLDLPGLLVSLVVVGITLAIGIWYFRNIEKQLADVI